jgi:rumA: 23S rRNA (uracil-5-)-methyltransferase RumA
MKASSWTGRTWSYWILREQDVISVLLEAVCRLAPEKIIYISCDPATMARDIRYLTNDGYEFCQATPVDMFPWTGATEVVAKLMRR